MNKYITDIIKNIKNISLPVIFLSLIIMSGFINNLQYGGGLSTQIPFVILFFGSFLVTNKKINIKKTHFLIVIFWIIITISTITSNIVTPQQNIFSFLIYIVIYVIATGIYFNKFEISFILNSYIFTALIASLSIIHNFLIDNQYGWQRYSAQFFGTYKDPNYVSAFILPAFLMVLYSFINKKKNKKITITLMIIFSAGLLATGSRSAFLFFVFSFFILFLILLFKTDIKNSKKYILIFIIFGILMLSWMIAKNLLPDSLINRITNFSNYTSGTSRLTLWNFILEAFVELPGVKLLFGQGLESSNALLTSLNTINTHNLYVDILFASGIIGFLIFTGILLCNLESKKIDKIFIVFLFITTFGPLFFINGFNTPSFWTPVVLFGIISSKSRQTQTPFFKWY